jgi:hypothetical protein
MKTILLVLATAFITTQYNAQNNEAPSAEQMAEWRKMAHEEGQKTLKVSFVSSYLKHKIILLVVGAVVVAIGGAIVNSNKNEN